MRLIKWFNCKYRNKHSMKVFEGEYFRGRTLCEVCFKSQNSIDNPEKYRKAIDRCR